MYYDGPVRTSPTRSAPPFRIDFVAGLEDVGLAARVEVLPLAQLYFCDSCSRVLSRSAMAEEVLAYFCPHCLDNMPSSEAMHYGMRCSKCWECPVCASTTMMNTTSGAREQIYFLACGFCRWSSKGAYEAAQPEQLIAQIMALEREAPPRKRLSTLVEAFRGKANEQQREREMAQRMRKRASIARHTLAMPGGAFSFGVRRMTTATLRAASRRTLVGTPFGGAGGIGSFSPMGEPSESSPAGGGALRWEEVEARLEERTAERVDIRCDARAALAAAAAAAAAAATASPTSPQGSGTGDAGKDGGGPSSATATTTPRGSITTPRARSSISSTMSSAASPGPAPEVPMLEGLTVEELLSAHTAADEAGGESLMAAFQRSLEAKTCDGVSSLSQRLQQLCHGYHRRAGGAGGAGQVTSPSPRDSLQQQEVSSPRATERRAQLESPIEHADTWALLPVRKSLLTKRSRRCQVPKKEGSGGEPAPPPVGADPLDPGVAQRSVCKGIVVKPQINPCANPPFEKNSMASHFIPRCTPWAWEPQSEAAPGVVVFVMANPLDSDVRMHFDATAFNASTAAPPDGRARQGSDEVAPQGRKLFQEQNVEVLTKPFDTVILRFDENEVWTTESDKLMKAAKEQDDVDVIPERKLHKILVRLRFRLASESPDPAAVVFFATVRLRFSGHSRAEHEVEVVLRFALPRPRGSSGAEGPTFVPPARSGAVASASSRA